MNLTPAMLYGVFAVNGLLILIDVTIGYRLAPVMFKAAGGDEDDAEHGVRRIRRLLALVVGTYMFFNCYGLFNQRPGILLFVTIFVVVDMAGQLYINHRYAQANRHQ